MLVEAALLLPLTTAGLYLLGFRRVHSAMDRLARLRRRMPPRDPSRHANRATHLIRYLGRNGPVRGNCLSRSLVLWYLLRRAGVQGELRVGVSTQEGPFAAHAWVEYEGRPLNAGHQVGDHYSAFDEAIRPKGADLP